MQPATATPPEEIGYVRDCESILEGNRVPGANLLLAGILVSLTVILIWASIADLEEVSRGLGKVIPSRSVQVIQSLEGGILSEIHVSEGETVEEGQLLVRIDDTLFASQVSENVARREILTAQIARLEAEFEGLEEPSFPEELVSKRPDLVAQQTELFESRRRLRDESISVVERSLTLAEEEMEMTGPLANRGVVSKVEKLRLDRELNELRGQVQTIQNEYRRKALEEKEAAAAELESLMETMKAHEDRVLRAKVRAPVAGTVNKIHIKTVGGVIGAGADIMEIVPVDDTLLVEANVRPSDIAFLHPGQEAMTKITAYDFAIYGGLPGKVEHISATTIQEEDGERFYQIKVRTESNTLEHNGHELPIIPGMVAEVDVITGKRTVLQYLLKPFNRAKGRAFTER